MDKLQRVLNGNESNTPNAGNPSIMNEVFDHREFQAMQPIKMYDGIDFLCLSDG